MEVFDKILNWKFTNTENTTGLPEYRYGLHTVMLSSHSSRYSNTAPAEMEVS